MTWYLGFQLQEPFDFGQDERKRCVYAMNVEALKRPSSSFIEETLAALESAGVGTREVNIFGTSSVSIPDGDGPYLLMVSVPGQGPVRTHGGRLDRPRARILVTAKSSAAAKAMAHAAYDALDPETLRNRQVSA